MEKVLLTGITGFLGSHTAIQLLEQNYKVVGTLRSMQRAAAIKATIAQHTSKIGNLELRAAELSDATVWKELTRSVDYVQHIASPFPRVLPKREDELLLPAVNGVLHILKAAAANGVKRVVLTSSSSAISYGKSKSQRSGIYDENTWTDTTITTDITPYFKSKTLAEAAAWEFMAKDRSGMELSTILPGAILGPVLEEDFGTSANIVIKTLDGSMPAIPDIGFDMVDVRSVAQLLILAMQKPEAAQQRYAASAGFMKFKSVVEVLRQAYPHLKFPSVVLPDFAVRLFANFDRTLKPVLLDLGVERKIDSTKAKTQLGWRPIPAEEAILACAESVLKVGIVK